MSWTRNSSAMSTSNNRINYRIQITQNSQSVSNNRSSVTVKVHVWRNNTGYTTYGSGTVYVTIDGKNYSASISPSQKFTYNSYTEVFSRTLNINHGSNGAKTLNTSARISHSQFSSSSQSFNTALTTIPRASTLSAFSFANSLRPNNEVTINYTVDRKSSSFRHQIQLRDGSTTIKTWDNISSNGSSTLTLDSSSVNTLLKRLSNVTTKSLTLRVATRNGSGGSWVGSAVTRNANIRVSSTVKPTASGISVSISGSGRDKAINKYVQGKTRVTSSFNASAGYGASISSRTIVIRRVSGGADSQSINSNSGTTGRAVSLSGTYEAIGTVKDSRGRTSDPSRTTFTVEAYSSPTISSFSANRNSSTQTTVNISHSGSHSHLGGSNPLTYTVQRRMGSGSWANVTSGASGTNKTGSYSASATSTGNSVTTSYDFRLRIVDTFGESAERIVTVSTQRVVLDIHKNEGVGIGKIHENGVLDVDGDVYLRGGVHMRGRPTSGQDFQLVIDPEEGNGSIELGSSTVESTPFIDFHTTGKNNDRDARIIARTGSGSGNEDAILDLRASEIWHRGTPLYTKGSNSNGDWVRWGDGTQICYKRDLRLKYDSASRLTGTWRFPSAFIEEDNLAVIVSRRSNHGVGYQIQSVFGAQPDNPSQATVRAYWSDGSYSSSNAILVNVIALGRWR